MDQNRSEINKNHIWKKRFNKAIKYAESLDYEVRVYKVHKKISSVNLDTKIIKIYSGHCDEYKLYYLLHEIGHILLSESTKLYQSNVGYGQSYFSRNSLTNKISVLEEEYEAWKVGKSLTVQIGIRINKRNYEKLKSVCIASYAKSFFKGK